MKSSLSKLKKIALHKNDAKEKRNFQHSAKLDELVQAAKDMQEMRDCYDSLLSAAAATANSAYEFSESLREMGSCLLEKSALHDDEESDNVFLMLGKVQFELQKLVDSYRSHIILTITKPSESLLNELRTVEEMKRQCDEKRDVYEYMMTQQKEKGRSKSYRGDTSPQLQTARDEYNEEATLCVFRLKSLKQGQSRSLLTQAVRHHAAQLNFFQKGLKSLEAVEPHVRLVTEQQHIDYQFSGLEDDGEDGGNSFDANEDGELSFDYRSNKPGLDVVPLSHNSTEHVGDMRLSLPRVSAAETGEENLDKSLGDHKFSYREARVSSYSAPIFAEKKLDLAEKARQLQMSSTRVSNTYVLPTPVDAKETKFSRTSSSVHHKSGSGHARNMWHSSPLEEKKNEKASGDDNLSEPTVPKVQSILKESNSNLSSIQLPRPSAEGLSLSQIDIFNASDAKKIKRQAFSGPLSSKSWSTKPVSSASGSTGSTDVLQLPRLPVPQSSPPKVSPNGSPLHVSSPKISQLHELPRPPGNLFKPTKSSTPIGYSAPLFRNQELSTANRSPSVAPSGASPLPTPPLVIPRSFSIPSSNQRAMALHVAKLLDTPHVSEKGGGVASPPLSPIALSNTKPMASSSSEIQVDAGGS